MNRIAKQDIVKLLASQLGKKVDQFIVERWSASFWENVKRKEPVGKDIEPFVMMLPPPNITGNLHLGHALTVALQDALIRHRRMLGRRSVWIPGFDHAGISTQTIIEKLIWRKHKMTRQEYGRENLIKLAHEWKDTKRTQMKDQIDRLGLMLNYEQEYFTLDDKSSLAVQAAFKQLFHSGLIYRSVKPVFWSKQMQTTLSDIEVERVDGHYKFARTGEIVERRDLSQWFVSAQNMACKAVEVVEKGCIDMIPENYKRTWSAWLLDNGVQDWCISRQNWWGHRIPAYKLKSSEDVLQNWVVADSLPEALVQLNTTNQDDVIQDPDILDTWFSSSLLPLTISDWPNADKFKQKKEAGLFPLDIMETGFDILTFWVSKMVMMSLALTNEIPFRLILLHGMICDSGGKKMSKSKGNVIDPLDVINGARLEELQQKTKESNAQGIIDDSEVEFVLKNQKRLFPSGIPQCGADGLRTYLLSHDVQEEVVRIQIMQIDKIRRLSNKVWNLCRFVINLVETLEKHKLKLEYDLKELNREQLGDDDVELLEKLAHCVQVTQESFMNNYQLHNCFRSIEIFLNIQLSSKYIETNKDLLLKSDIASDRRELKLQILIKSLETSIKLLHPYMPHLTEFLYQKLFLCLANIEEKDIKLENLVSIGDKSFPDLNEWRPYLQMESNKDAT